MLGNLQRVDASSTYAPVAATSSIRILITLAARYQRHIYKTDIRAAFLNAECPADKPVFIRPPYGTDYPADIVPRLRRALYGLRVSPRLWNDEMTDRLLRLGFTRSDRDPSVYFQRSSTQHRRLVAILVTWVDDLLVCFLDDTTEGAML